MKIRPTLKFKLLNLKAVETSLPILEKSYAI